MSRARPCNLLRDDSTGSGTPRASDRTLRSSDSCGLSPPWLCSGNKQCLRVFESLWVDGSGLVLSYNRAQRRSSRSQLFKLPQLRTVLDEAFEIFGAESEYVVAMPGYRAAANTANTAMGWKNSNLRTGFMRLLRRAGVPPWPRLFHSMRASRQTELQREFPIHVVCSWLGNSPQVAQQSYLLVTEDDFARAAGVK